MVLNLQFSPPAPTYFLFLKQENTQSNSWLRPSHSKNESLIKKNIFFSDTNDILLEIHRKIKNEGNYYPN